jgi:hypothetical protein
VRGAFAGIKERCSLPGREGGRKSSTWKRFRCGGFARVYGDGMREEALTPIRVQGTRPRAASGDLRGLKNFKLAAVTVSAPLSS